MRIIITSGVGEGSTELSAFDKALKDAGIANYNLIPLSSVIPPSCEIIEQKINWNEKEFGHKLFVVISTCTATKQGEQACAGLGWAYDKKGLFVEHHGKSEQEVKELIMKSLNDMLRYRDIVSEINAKIVSIKCEQKPVCSIVAAVYQSEGWSQP